MKKVLSLALVAALALGMSSVAFAATAKVDKAARPTNAYFTPVTTYGDTVGTGPVTSIDLGEIKVQSRPTYEFKISTAALTAVVQSPLAPFSTNFLTKQEIAASKMSVKFKASKGSAAIDSVGFDGDKVQVKFVKPYKSTSGTDFDIKVYLIVDGTQWSNPSDGCLQMIGNYANLLDDTNVDASSDYFDLSDGYVVKPTEFVKSIQLSLGNGVEVYGRLLKNSKYWGVSNQDISDVDQENFIKYPAIDAVFHNPNIGLATIADYVVLADIDPTSYVYDGDFKLLGRGKDHLAFAETYYVAAAELDVETDEEPVDEEPTDDDVINPDDNANDNPGTGR